MTDENKLQPDPAATSSISAATSSISAATSSISDDSSPVNWRRLGFGCGSLLFLLLALLAVLRVETNKLLKARIEKVQQERLKLEALLVDQRRYPFDNLQNDEASRFYRSVDWLCTESSSPLKITSSDLPALERGLLTGKTGSIQTHGQSLARLLDESLEKTNTPQTEIDAARAFAEEHGQTILELLSRGVHSDHIRWPADLKQGAFFEISDLLVQRSAASLALYMASQKAPSEAIEIALIVNCFGRDHARHPSLIGTMIGTAIEQLSLSSLERRLRQEGDEPSTSDLERIIHGLGAMPPSTGRAMDFDAIVFDSTLANLMAEPDPQSLREVFGEAAFFATPEIVIWQWGKLDRYRRELAPLWTLPLDEARALQSEVFERMENEESSVLARMALPNFMNARLSATSCQSRTELIRLAAAARLFRIKNGSWPKSPSELSALFRGEVPKDPLASGAEFTFTLVEDNWTASARTVDRPLSITLPARRDKKSSE